MHVARWFRLEGPGVATRSLRSLAPAGRPALEWTSGIGMAGHQALRLALTNRCTHRSLHHGVDGVRVSRHGAGHVHPCERALAASPDAQGHRHPAFHHWHHSAEREAVDRNSPCTRRSGTSCSAPATCPTGGRRYGLADDAGVPAGWLKQLVHPVVRRGAESPRAARALASWHSPDDARGSIGRCPGFLGQSVPQRAGRRPAAVWWNGPASPLHREPHQQEACHEGFR